MSQDFRQLVPALPPAADIFAAHHLAYEFRREAEYRQDLQTYCEWYYAVAQQHRQELQKMRGDFNILGWFNRRRY